MTCDAQKYLWVGWVEFFLLSLKGWHLHINWPLCFSSKPRSLYLMCCHANERCLRGALREFTHSIHLTAGWGFMHRIHCIWLQIVGQKLHFLMRPVYEWIHMLAGSKFWAQRIHFLLMLQLDGVFGHPILVFFCKILQFLDPTGEIFCWMEVFGTVRHFLKQMLHMQKVFMNPTMKPDEAFLSDFLLP